MTDTEQYVTHCRWACLRVEISGDIDLGLIESRVKQLLEPLFSELGSLVFIDLEMEEHSGGRCQQCYAKEHEVKDDEPS